MCTAKRLIRTAASRHLMLIAMMSSVTGCSPGALPGSPSPIVSGGGGGRYNGTFSTRRVAGSFTLTEAPQALSLSVVLSDTTQITARFEAGESRGTLHGVLNGSLANGTFEATVLITTAARQGSATSSCEGRGDITGTLSGVNLAWNGGTITYDNCPGLAVASQAQAIAVSPIPASTGGRATVAITIPGGPSIRRSTCSTGVAGYPFTVEITETAGVGVTFDSTFMIEERRGFGAASITTLDMPFTELAGGARRIYGACSPFTGTYQAFFSGADANGNRVRVASPVVTLAP